MMRRALRVLPLVVVAGVLVASALIANAAPPAKNFVANLRGEHERPEPVESAGNGTTVFHLNKDGTELRYRLVVTNLEDVTQAHIHCGNADVAGPVVAFLFGLVPEGVTSNGVLAEGTITAADVIARPDSAVCPGGVANFDDLIEKMRTGEAYVNVHTVAFPPGEIRGQIRAAGN